MAKLSAAMIVKDEELFLEDCLRSIAPHVAEIVVVDTGSTDRTCEIARAAGARVIERAWPGDFAEARNWALDAATGDWILYIDADERMIVPEGLDVAALLDAPEAAAFYVRYRGYAAHTPYGEVRLFRNDPRIRFESIIHEQVHRSIQKVCGSDGLAIPQCEVEIVHLGSEGDLTRKYLRNLPLLQKALLVHPHRIYLYYDLGNALAGLGRKDEALEAFREGISRAVRDRDPKQRADGSCIFAKMSLYLLSLEMDALPVALEGLQHFPENHVLWMAKAHALIRAGDAEAALPILDRLLSIDPESVFDPLIGYDRRIFGEYSHNLKGLAFHRLGRFTEAAESYEAAFAAAPDEMAYRVKAVAARAQAAKASRAAAGAAAEANPRSASAA